MKLEDINLVKETTVEQVNQLLAEGYKIFKIVKLSNGDGGEHISYVLGKQKP
jgi:hypothetical protein